MLNRIDIEDGSTLV